MDTDFNDASSAGLPKDQNSTHTVGASTENLGDKGPVDTPYKQILNLRDIIEHIKKTNVGINTPQSVFILFSLSYGAAIVILPYMVSQLGPIVWTIFTSIIILIIGFCTKLTKDSCAFLMNTLKFTEKTGDIYPEIAAAAGGPRLRKAVTFFLYMYAYTAAMAWLLLAASVFRDMIVFPSLSHYAQVRCWLTISVVVSFPIMCLENFDNLKSTAITAVMTSTLALLFIIVDSFIVKFTRGQVYKLFETEKIAQESFFVCFGSITFAAAGASYVLPSMYPFVKKPEKLSIAIIWTFCLTLVTYVIGGVIPYSVFGRYCRPTITTTLQIYFDRHYPHPVFRTFLLIAQLAIGVHLVLVAVLGLQPIFQNLERYFKVTKGFSWKRLLVRLSVALCVTATCLAIPNFQPVLSLVGGIPITFICIIFPIVIYMKLFELNVYAKISLIATLCTVSVLVAGNFVVGLWDIVAFYA